MANSASAKKNVRKNELNRVRNSARRSALKTAIKKITLSIESGAEHVDALLRDVASKLGRARGKGLIHRNTAARKLSRLAKKVAHVKKSASEAKPAA